MTLKAPFDLYAEGLKNLSSSHIAEAAQAFLSLALGAFNTASELGPFIDMFGYDRG